MSIRARVIRRLLEKCEKQDLIDLAPSLSNLIDSRGSINSAWTKPEVYNAFQENGVHLVRNSYYGLLLDTRYLPNSHWPNNDSPKVQPYWGAYSHLNSVSYGQLLSDVLSYREFFNAVSCDDRQKGFYWDNPMLPPLDAVIYYGLIRALKPSRIIEIGSGYSTMLAVDAAKHTATKISCIEPFPGPHLLAQQEHLEHLYQFKAQDTPLNKFEELEDGDILFFDGTHACKLGSDVNHLLFNILPALKKGVLVHLHDIFLPYEYPKNWIEDINIQWNEQYLVLAFLMSSNMFEVLLPNYLIGREQQEEISTIFSPWNLEKITQNMGGINGTGFWLRKL